jgi:hypothetical protein
VGVRESCSAPLLFASHVIKYWLCHHWHGNDVCALTVLAAHTKARIHIEWTGLVLQYRKEMFKIAQL